MSLHSWCKRVKERSRTLNSMATRSTRSIDEGDDTNTAASGTVSPCSSLGSLSARLELSDVAQQCGFDASNAADHDKDSEANAIERPIFAHINHTNASLV